MSTSRRSVGRGPLKIVVCYRREDTVDSTGRLYKDLRLHFNSPFRNYLKRRVVLVRDFDNIPAAVNYEDYIKEEIETSVAILAVIGNDWLKVKDPETGQRRIDDPDDSLRKELTTAISLSKPLIPVLVERAKMPGKEALPDALKDLATMNAREVYDPEWDAGVERLINDLEEILGRSGWFNYGAVALAVGALALFLVGARWVIPRLPSLFGSTVVNTNNANTATPPPRTEHTTPPTPANNNLQPGPAVIATPVVTTTPVQVPSPATPTPAPTPVEDLVASQWEVKLEGNIRYVWDFLPEGQLRRRLLGEVTYSPAGTWKQDGDTVIIQTSINDPDKEVYTGKIKGDRMEGRFVGLEEYDWSATRIRRGK